MMDRRKITIDEYMSMTEQELNDFLDRYEQLLAAGMIDENQPNVDLLGMSDEEIAFVIHYKKEEFRKKILFNVSENRRKTILEEEDRHTPMRKIDVEKATSLFFASMRRAWEEGKLFIKGRNDEIYV